MLSDTACSYSFLSRFEVNTDESCQVSDPACDPRETMDVIQEFRLAARDIIPERFSSNEFLRPFLMARKGDINRALKLLKNYRKLRSSYPEFFIADGLQLKPVLEQKLSTLLHLKAEMQLFIFRVGPWEPRTCTIEDIFRFNVTILRVAALSLTTQKCGLTAIVDLDGLSFWQARQFTPYYANLLVSLLQDSFPLRFRAIHFVNMPYAFSMIMSFVWPLLSEKFKQRVRLHKSLQSLNNELDADLLPGPYGSLDGDVDWMSMENIVKDTKLIL